MLNTIVILNAYFDYEVDVMVLTNGITTTLSNENIKNVVGSYDKYYTGHQISDIIHTEGERRLIKLKVSFQIQLDVNGFNKDDIDLLIKERTKLLKFGQEVSSTSITVYSQTEQKDLDLSSDD